MPETIEDILRRRKAGKQETVEDILRRRKGTPPPSQNKESAHYYDDFNYASADPLNPKGVPLESPDTRDLTLRENDPPPSPNVPDSDPMVFAWKAREMRRQEAERQHREGYGPVGNVVAGALDIGNTALLGIPKALAFRDDPEARARHDRAADLAYDPARAAYGNGTAETIRGVTHAAAGLTTMVPAVSGLTQAAQAARLGKAAAPAAFGAFEAGSTAARALAGSGETGEDVLRNGLTGIGFGAAAGLTGSALRAFLDRLPGTTKRALLKQIVDAVERGVPGAAEGRLGASLARREVLSNVLAEAGSMYAAGKATGAVFHPDHPSDDAVNAILGGLVGAAGHGVGKGFDRTTEPVAAEYARRRAAGLPLSKVETVQQQALRQMRATLDAEAPDVDEAVRERFLEGDVEGMDPTTLNRLGVVTRPILEQYKEAIPEAQKADAGAEPAGPEARFEALKGAHEEGLRGPKQEAAVEEALKDRYDPTVLPEEPAADEGRLFSNQPRFGESEAPQPPPSSLPWPEPQETPLFDAPKPAAPSRDEVRARLIRGAETPTPPVTAADLPDAPTASEGPPVEAPALTSEDFMPRGRRPKAAEGPSLSQFVRSEGGINAGELLRGEVERLGKKGSGTTGLLRRDGGGLDAEKMLQSAKESGYPVEGMTPAEFLDAVELDATKRGQMLSEESTDFEALAREREYEHFERLAMMEENIPSVGDRIEFIGEDGDPFSGTLERETGRRLVVKADDGTTQRLPRGTPVIREKPLAEEMGLVDRPVEADEDIARALKSMEWNRKEAAFAGTEQARKAAEREIRRLTKFIKESTGKPADIAERIRKKTSGESGFVDPDLGRAILRPFVQFHRWMRMASAPEISKNNTRAGELAGALIGSAGVGGQVAPLWSKHVFGDAKPEARQRFTDAAVEFQLDTKRQEIAERLKAATDPLARLTLKAKLDAVKTHFGEEGFAFKNRAEWEAYWKGEEAAAFRQRHRDLWHGKTALAEGLPSPEEMYRYLQKQGFEVDDIVSTDPRDEMRLNMVATRDAEGEVTPEGERQAARKKGERVFGRRSVENIRNKPHPFGREFTGGGQEYLRDFDALMENTYRRVYDRFVQAKFMEALEAGKDIVQVKDGQEPPEKIHGEEAVRIDPEFLPRARIVADGAQVATAPAVHVYARKSFVPEMKQLLRMNDAVSPNRAAHVLNNAALFGVFDNLWNAALDTTIATSAPGAGVRGSKAGLYAGVLNNAVGAVRLLAGVVVRPKGYREQHLRLQTIGAFREGRTPEWTKESFLADLKTPAAIYRVPMKALGRFAARIHEAGRRILDDSYTELVKRGMAEDSDIGRREFINRMGQYSGRGMGAATQYLRDKGWLPFSVAQRKSASMVGRTLTMSGGAGTKGVGVRVAQFTKLLSVATVIGLWNYMKTGDPRGRPGVPFLAMDLGDEDPVTKNPRYSDMLGDLTGLRQAATASGVRGFFTSKRRGLTDAQTADAVAASLMNSWFVKFMSSPTTGFAWRFGTGREPYYNSRQETENIPGEQSEALLHPGFAAKKAFQPLPALAAATGLKSDTDPGLSEIAGGIAFAPKQGMKAEAVESLSDRIHWKDAAEYVDFLRRKFRTMTNEEIDREEARIREAMTPAERKQFLPALVKARNEAKAGR